MLEKSPCSHLERRGRTANYQQCKDTSACSKWTKWTKDVLFAQIVIAWCCLCFTVGFKMSKKQMTSKMLSWWRNHILHNVAQIWWFGSPGRRNWEHGLSPGAVQSLSKRQRIREMDKALLTERFTAHERLSPNFEKGASILKQLLQPSIDFPQLAATSRTNAACQTPMLPNFWCYFPPGAKVLRRLERVKSQSSASPSAQM